MDGSQKRCNGRRSCLWPVYVTLLDDVHPTHLRFTPMTDTVSSQSVSGTRLAAKTAVPCRAPRLRSYDFAADTCPVLPTNFSPLPLTVSSLSTACTNESQLRSSVSRRPPRATSSSFAFLLMLQPRAPGAGL